jgi:hypothetical protein
MDEYRYQRLLSEEATFEHPSNFHFVDVWRYEVDNLTFHMEFKH